MDQGKLVLLFGVTGLSGFHVARVLLSHGYHVRIVTRSKEKVSNLFKGKQSQFENIIVGNLGDRKILDQAFKPSQKYGKISYVVSTLGTNVGDNDLVEQVQYVYQQSLINRSKQAGIDKYVYLSAFLISKPDHQFQAEMNKVIPNAYYWKGKAENYLRQSGLNYIIARGPNLTGDQNDLTVTKYNLFQGDNHTGKEKITRSTLAEIIRVFIESKTIPDKVTFQCVETHHPKIQHSIQSLQPDNEDSIIKLPENPPC